MERVRSVAAYDGASLVDQASSKEAAAKDLARRHYDLEPGLVRVYRLHSRNEDAHAEPIKLLEVNEDTIAAGVMPLHFGPAPAVGIPFSTVIVEVTPEEFRRIEARELRLPEDWEIGPEYSRPLGLAGGS
jgi:hypothetical protein